MNIIIISGGQTGVDRAALDIAVELDIPHEGWCPKGRLAEDGVISTLYNLQETKTQDYSERTRQNIERADGTLIFIQEAIESSPGTLLTASYATEIKKPCLILNLAKEIDWAIVHNWINDHQVQRLNIAGPRESQAPGIYEITKQCLRHFFTEILEHSSQISILSSSRI